MFGLLLSLSNKKHSSLAQLSNKLNPEMSPCSNINRGQQHISEEFPHALLCVCMKNCIFMVRIVHIHNLTCICSSSHYDKRPSLSQSII